MSPSSLNNARHTVSCHEKCIPTSMLRTFLWGSRSNARGDKLTADLAPPDITSQSVKLSLFKAICMNILADVSSSLSQRTWHLTVWFPFTWLSSAPYKTSRFSSINAPLSLIVLKALILVTHWSLLAVYSRLQFQTGFTLSHENGVELQRIRWQPESQWITSTDMSSDYKRVPHTE